MFYQNAYCWSVLLYLIIKHHSDGHLVETFSTWVKVSIKIQMSTPFQQAKQCRVSKTHDTINLIVCTFSARMIVFWNPLFFVLCACCVLYLQHPPHIVSQYLPSIVRNPLFDLKVSKSSATIVFSVKIFFWKFIFFFGGPT